MAAPYLFVAISAVLSLQSDAYSSGVPSGACGHITPNHYGSSPSTVCGEVVLLYDGGISLSSSLLATKE